MFNLLQKFIKNALDAKEIEATHRKATQAVIGNGYYLKNFWVLKTVFKGYLDYYRLSINKYLGFV